MNLSEILDGCRQRWSRPEGKLGAIQARVTRHRDFNSDFQGDSIPPDRIGGYRLLLDQGRVVWSAVVQASGEIYATGDQDLPAFLTYGLTDYYNKRPEALSTVARRLFFLRDEELPEGDEKCETADALRSITPEPLRIALPLSITAGHSGVYLGTSLLHRRRLPTRRLTLSGLPIVVLPERTVDIMPLPLRYWPSALTKYWQDEEVAASGLRPGQIRITGLMEAPETMAPPSRNGDDLPEEDGGE